MQLAPAPVATLKVLFAQVLFPQGGRVILLAEAGRVTDEPIPASETPCYAPASISAALSPPRLDRMQYQMYYSV